MQIKKIITKNQNGFRRIRSTISQFFTIHRIVNGVCAKTFEATILFVNFSRAFEPIYIGKMKQILLAYGLPNETVAGLMVLYKDMKVKVRSPDGDSDYFEIIA